jgi:phage shock protein PspC (stress-responsive transcriptional regulator)
VLTPKALTPNISQKLFRNPKDRVLGGVCSGLAHFFNTEVWVVRLIFVAPLILQFISNNHTFIKFHFLGTSLASFTFSAYIILWFITPLAKASTDYMLLKGEPININTIQNPNSMNFISNISNDGFNKFLKVVAYILLAMIIVALVISTSSFTFGGLFVYNIAEIILFTAMNKTLALVAAFIFIGLPILALAIWLIRKVAGYKSPNKLLRTLFAAVWIFGFVCVALLAVSLMKRMNTAKSIEEVIPLNTNSDTLYVDTKVRTEEYTQPFFLN